MFRDPKTTWNSWKQQGWLDVNLFIKSYQKSFDLMQNAKKLSNNVRVATYENLLNNKERMFRQLFKFWELPFSPKSLEKSKHLYTDHPRMLMDSNFRARVLEKAPIYGTHDLDARGFFPEAPRDDITTPEELEAIKPLNKLYATIKQLEAIDFPVDKKAQEAAQVVEKATQSKQA